MPKVIKQRHTSIKQIVRAWLLEVAVLMRRYKDELLSAALDLLLSAPSALFPPQASSAL